MAAALDDKTYREKKEDPKEIKRKTKKAEKFDDKSWRLGKNVWHDIWPKNNTSDARSEQTLGWTKDSLFT